MKGLANPMGGGGRGRGGLRSEEGYQSGESRGKGEGGGGSRGIYSRRMRRAGISHQPIHLGVSGGSSTNSSRVIWGFTWDFIW